jgi:hypothetical protein
MRTTKCARRICARLIICTCNMRKCWGTAHAHMSEHCSRLLRMFAMTHGGCVGAQQGILYQCACMRPIHTYLHAEFLKESGLPAHGSPINISLCVYQHKLLDELRVSKCLRVRVLCTFVYWSRPCENDHASSAGAHQVWRRFSSSPLSKQGCKHTHVNVCVCVRARAFTT